MNKNINKHDMVDKLDDGGSTTDKRNRVGSKFNGHLKKV